MITIGDLFNIEYGVNLEFSKMILDKDGIPFISRKSENNGMKGRVKILDDIDPNPAGTISVACGGSVMESFLQIEPYYSGRDILCLTPKLPMNNKQKLFYCMAFRANKYRYNYGRQANKTLALIPIPKLGALPDYV